MRINPLWRYEHPDLSSFVIHFVHRSGNRVSEVPPDILSQDPFSRVLSIMFDEAIRAFPVFGQPEGDPPVVCFTECTPGGVTTLIKEQRYEPWGIGFRKDAVFAKGGGPAFYVRGDEYHLVRQMPRELRFRATRFWPGAEPEQGETLGGYTSGRSEFTHEREWRVIGTGDPPCFRFVWSDVAFILVPDRDAWAAMLIAVEEELGSDAAAGFPSWVWLDRETGAIWDADDVWITPEFLKRLRVVGPSKQ